MKNTLRLLVILLSFNAGYAQTVRWAKSYGASLEQTVSTRGTNTRTDSQGNVYVTGFFKGTVNFEPESENFIFTAEDTFDAFLQKLDSNGNVLWVKVFNNQGTFDLPIINIDSQDNVIIVGAFMGELDLNPNEGTDIKNSISYLDNTYIVKLDTNGNYIYGKVFENLQDNMWVFSQAVTLDHEDNLIVAGFFNADVDFDLGVGENIKTAIGERAFIAKYDPNMNLLWVKSFNGTTAHELDFMAVAIDSQNNILTGGSLMYTVDLDPGSGNFNVSSPAANNRDMFLLKMDTEGNFVWARTAESTYTPTWQINDENESVSSIVIDQEDNVYFSGFFRSYINLDPSGTDFILDSGIPAPEAGGYSSMLCKVDATGNMVWAKRMEGENFLMVLNNAGGPASGSSLSFNSQGQLIFGMGFWGELNIDVSGVPTTFAPSPLGSAGIAFMELSPEDATCNAAYFVTNNHHITFGNLYASGEYTYATGGFWETINFDEDTSVTAALSESAFIAKFSPSTLGTETFTLNNPAIYPNPVSDMVYIQKGDNVIESITVMDISGKVVKEVTPSLSSDVESISLGSLSKGVYILQMKSSKEMIVKKLIVK